MSGIMTCFYIFPFVVPRPTTYYYVRRINIPITQMKKLEIQKDSVI